MGTVGKEIGLYHPGQKGVDLSRRQPVSGFNGRLAGHIGQDVVEPACPSVPAAFTAEPLQNIHEQRTGITLSGQRRDG